jgi:hypothetical protein
MGKYWTFWDWVLLLFFIVGLPILATPALLQLSKVLCDDQGVAFLNLILKVMS